MQTAGHAVLASGVTVAISLLALVVVPVPFLRSMGYRRHADPARQRGRRAHPAAGAARRASARASTGRGSAHEGTASRGWTAWARLHRQAPLSLAAGVGAGRPGAADRPGVQPQDRPGEHRLAGQQRPAVRRLADPDRRRRRHRRAHADRGARPGGRRRRPSRTPPRQVDGRPAGRGLGASTDGRRPSSTSCPSDETVDSSTQRRGRRRARPRSRALPTATSGSTGAGRDGAGLLHRGLRQVPVRARA